MKNLLKPILALVGSSLLLTSCGLKTSESIDLENLEGKAKFEVLTTPEETMTAGHDMDFIDLDESPGRYLDIRAVGDAGWARNGRPINSDNGFFDRLTEFDPNREILIGDINFINWETTLGEECVNTKSDIAGARLFSFVAHPNSVRNALDFGYNLFNLTNNHSRDCFEYSNSPRPDDGEAEKMTTQIMEQLMEEYHNSFVWHGMHTNAYIRFRPKTFSIEKGGRIVTVAFNAIYLYGGQGAGYCNIVDNFSNCFDHKNEILAGLAASNADLKLLSIHSQGRNAFNQLRDLASDFIHNYDGDIVLGHGSHRIQPVRVVEKADNSFGVIFEDFGNFLHPGVRGHGDNYQGRVLIDLETLQIAQVQVTTLATAQRAGVDGVLRASDREVSTVPSNFSWTRGINGLTDGLGNELNTGYFNVPMPKVEQENRIKAHNFQDLGSSIDYSTGYIGDTSEVK